MPTNEFGQTIGPPLPDWTPRVNPPRAAIAGRFCTVEPLDQERHHRALYDQIFSLNDGRWTYLPYGPFENHAAFVQWMDNAAASADPMFYTLTERRTGAIGVAAYMRIDCRNGVIEIGHLNYSPGLKRTAAATEAMYLLMRRAFDELGYRRYEWKCDSFNMPSRRAALRLGFTYEGLFRQAVVYKQRNRDTTWFSITDAEWPARRAAFESWLATDNIGDTGTERQPLSRFMAASDFRYDHR